MKKTITPLSQTELDKQLEGFNEVFPVEQPTHEIAIGGCVSVPVELDADRFTDLFLEWVEQNGWSFGGGIGEYSWEKI